MTQDLPDNTTNAAVINQPSTVLGVAHQQFLAVSQQTVPGSSEESYNLNSFSYPAGLSAQNFHGAVVALHTTAAGPVNAQVIDPNGFVSAQTAITVTASAYFQIFLPLVFGAIGTLPANIQVNNQTSGSLVVDIILIQDPIITASVIAGIAPGFTLPVTLPQSGAAGGSHVALSASPPVTASISGVSGFLLKSITGYAVIGTATTTGLIVIEDSASGEIIAELAPATTTGIFPLAVHLTSPYQLATGGTLEISQVSGSYGGQISIAATW